MFDPQRDYPSVVPYARYQDIGAAIDWLHAVLGAVEALRMTLPDGRIGHAELALGQNVITLGLAVGGSFPESPPVDRDAVRAMTLVYVSDVDVAAARAVELGGALVDPPGDKPWGLRQAIVTDPEGHVWELSRHLRDVPPASWGATTSGPWAEPGP